MLPRAHPSSSSLLAPRPLVADLSTTFLASERKSERRARVLFLWAQQEKAGQFKGVFAYALRSAWPRHALRLRLSTLRENGLPTMSRWDGDAFSSRAASCPCCSLSLLPRALTPPPGPTRFHIHHFQSLGGPRQGKSCAPVGAEWCRKVPSGADWCRFQLSAPFGTGCRLPSPSPAQGELHARPQRPEFRQLVNLF